MKIQATDSRKKGKYKLERKESCSKFKEKAENNPKNVVGRLFLIE
jgi:hypothetical protein